MNQFKIDKGWTLFLDRDGVINKRLVGKYISDHNDFVFNDGVVQCLVKWRRLFERIIVVTNQQGIGKGVVTAEEVERVNDYMCQILAEADVKIDKVYVCPALVSDNDPCRKPRVGMGNKAKHDFPEIDFKKSIMIGDSVSDIKFGQNLGMKSILVLGKDEELDQQAELEVVARIKTWNELDFFIL